MLLVYGMLHLPGRAAPLGTGKVVLQWELPTTNEDGSALTNLVECRIYVRLEGQAYDFGNPAITIPTSTNAPPEGTSMSGTVSNLADGVYFFVGTAANQEGLESDVSGEVRRVLGGTRIQLR